MSKPKICFLISGQMRTNSLSNNKITNNYLNKSFDKYLCNTEIEQNFNCDVFLSVDNCNIDKTKAFFGNKLKNIHCMDNDFYLNPINSKILPYEFYKNQYNNYDFEGCGDHFTSCVMQFYRLYDCLNLVENINEYKYIIRIRPDAKFYVNIYQFLNKLEQNNNILLFGDIGYSAIGRTDIMIHYCKLIEKIGTYKTIDKYKFIKNIACHKLFTYRPKKEWWYTVEVQSTIHLMDYCFMNNLDIDTSLNSYHIQNIEYQHYIFPAKKINDIGELNEKNNFLIYDKKVEKNILFIGSCRISSLMYYLAKYNSHRKYNIYGIYVVTYTGNKINNLPKNQILEILKNTDIIICEQMCNYRYLNSDENLSENFFKEFNVDKKIKIIHIPNLELRMYHHDIINIFGQQKNNVYNYHLMSKKHLFDLNTKLGFLELNTFIETNLTKYKLFSTANHPTRILSLYLFKLLVAKIYDNNFVETDLFEELFEEKFLEGNDTPIIKEDIELYNFKFNTNLQSSDILNDKNKKICDISLDFPSSLFK